MNKVIPFSLKETWPIIGIITSICHYKSGYYRYENDCNQCIENCDVCFDRNCFEFEF